MNSNTDSKVLGQRGAALIMVLWAAMFVSVALAIAIASARIEARIERARLEGVQRDLALGNALDYAAMRIASENRPVDDSVRSISFASNGYNVSIETAREAGKLDINLASEAMLEAFFAFQGLDQQEAARLAARVADWRDADDLPRPNGAERLDYARARNGERIGNRPFYAIEELSLVLDMPEEIVRCAAPAMTIFGDGDLPDPDLLQEVYGRDFGARVTTSTTTLGTASRAAAAGRRYAITAIAIKTNGASTRPVERTGVFRVTGAGATPYEWIAQFDGFATKNVLACRNFPDN